MVSPKEEPSLEIIFIAVSTRKNWGKPYRISPQSVNIQNTQSFPLRRIGFLVDSYSPFP